MKQANNLILALGVDVNREYEFSVYETHSYFQDEQKSISSIFFYIFMSMVTIMNCNDYVRPLNKK